MAKFLESRGMPERALEVATDADYRFELAVQLGELDTALAIAGEADSESKWKQLGELAMSAGKLDVRLLTKMHTRSLPVRSHCCIVQRL